MTRRLTVLEFAPTIIVAWDSQKKAHTCTPLRATIFPALPVTTVMQFFVRASPHED